MHFHTYQNNNKSGFTLIELLVVVAIIGLLSSIMLTSINNARNRAGSVVAVSNMKQFTKNVQIYVLDTGVYPPTDCMVESNVAQTCNASNDPFINSLGVVGWKGPYVSMWDKKHYWGGHLGYEYGGDDLTSDADGDGFPDYFIFFDDDAPGTTGANNSGLIPVSELLKMDQKLDDGNLATGNFRGNGNGWVNQATAAGEAAMRFDAR